MWSIQMTHMLWWMLGGMLVLAFTLQDNGDHLQIDDMNEYNRQKCLKHSIWFLTLKVAARNLKDVGKKKYFKFCPYAWQFTEKECCTLLYWKEGPFLKRIIETEYFMVWNTFSMHQWKQNSFECNDELMCYWCIWEKAWALEDLKLQPELEAEESSY